MTSSAEKKRRAIEQKSTLAQESLFSQLLDGNRLKDSFPDEIGQVHIVIALQVGRGILNFRCHLPDIKTECR